MSSKGRWVIVDWDDDGENAPRRRLVPAGVVADYHSTAEADEADLLVSDWLSDEFGWCVNGWRWEDEWSS